MEARFDFTGKTVAVTGAGGGFGSAIAKLYSDAGAKIWGSDFSEENLARIAPLPGVRTQLVDLSQREAAAAWIAQVEEESGGPIDVLVNNVGGTFKVDFTPIENIEDAFWNKVFDINVHTAFVTCRAAVPGMKKAGSGNIVNISSGAGLHPALTGGQAYCSSKHAVVGLTRQLAAELGQFGIRVNSVAPGLIMNDEGKRKRWEAYSPEKRQAKLERTAIKYLGTSEDIANCVAFLASDLSSFISGQIISVDGGSF